ncbi:2-dehydro-3-deoxygalactonokinase [Sphingomonas sp. AP4-R1]|uniref:2-dehydro-3-deoxygalactonokinase n=1 Tax=Sphingomonas sp. AP4-R1 TaxID=2735134 RepID=UPI0014938988|nr:2-dehydro-3-deoxygalactonokinase [Sphingomonas sp. AP4-R1]QJU57746.1 2-dehydro-3-deoxygalactonokinase [Sphingomonas sp. AP4-R1]
MSAQFVGDWGTTRLRLFRLEDGAVADRRDGLGIGQLTGSPAEALSATLGDWADAARATGLTLCGMAGSRNGLVEAPYVPCPAGFSDWAGKLATTAVDGVAVRIAGGLSGANFAGASDVMRGEETQIFGALSLDPSLGEGRRLLVMPGTHSKWVELDEGRVTRFQTSFTGELFALLRDQSILTRLGSNEGVGEADGEDGFAAGLARIRQTGALIASLFEARAAQLIDGRSRAWATGFLSGLAIGAEVIENLRLAAATPGTTVTLIGAPALGALYTQALAAADCDTILLEGDHCALAGLATLTR